MAKVFLSLSALVLAASTTFAQNDSIWSHQLDRDATLDSGWVVQVPALSSDFFSAAYHVIDDVGANPERDVINGTMRVNGIGISVADFGATQTFTTVGVFRPNMALDPSGLTPDLGAPIAVSTASVTFGMPLYTFQGFPTTSDGSIPAGDTTAVAVVQFPAGDWGLLGIGCDSSEAAALNCGSSMDGFATPAVIAPSLDMGINIGQDNSSTSSCLPVERQRHGRLRCQTLGSAGGGTSVAAGDKLSCTVHGGAETLDLAFFASKPSASAKIAFRLYRVDAGPGSAPAAALGPALTALPDGDADGRGVFLRIDTPFPSGYAGNTFQFAAVWGNATPDCLTPGVGLTNRVTVVVGDDFGALVAPPFGICDDGTIETAWVIHIPSRSSDYFNNDFGDGTGQDGVDALSISVLDFVTAVPAFPTAGVSNANLVVDPTGSTPDVVGPGLLSSIAPFTFPSGTFATTSAQYVSHPAAAPGPSLGEHVHGWVQFAPGDARVAVGGDITTPNDCSFFTFDGYSSPAFPFGFIANWGIRLSPGLVPPPPFGQRDDGTIESSFVVQTPSGASDYINTNLGDGTGLKGVINFAAAVLDFGTSIPQFPKAGISNANLVLDPTGNTPDISGPGLLALFAPFTFPAGTFATTSAAYVTKTTSFPAQLGTNVHGWFQFPPGDPALLRMGVDTTFPNGDSFFSRDGYTTPAAQFLAPLGNWGIRILAR